MLTCVCPNAKVVLTAGTSSVVAVYEYHKKVRFASNERCNLPSQLVKRILISNVFCKFLMVS